MTLQAQGLPNYHPSKSGNKMLFGGIENNEARRTCDTSMESSNLSSLIGQKAKGLAAYFIQLSYGERKVLNLTVYTSKVSPKSSCLIAQIKLEVSVH